MATKATAKKSTSTAVATWDEELAKQAQVAAAQEASTATGQMYGLEGGILTFNDAPLPGNEMAVIVLDSIFETIFYAGKYDPSNPTGPTAFAHGRVEKELVWHENSSPEFAGKLCSESEVCEWGSADTGRGKAAKETRRVAMISAGMFDDKGRFQPFEEVEHFETAAIGYMRLPVTSVKGFAGYVKQVTSALKRPPHGVFTRVSVVRDSGTQFKVLFEPLSQVPGDLMAAIMARHEEAKGAIEFPYSPYEEPEEKPARSRAAKAPAKAAGRGKRY